ncbi:sensor histidine kinase [Candidatus Nitrosocosmicus franklandus]|uniref:histidine kinase n=1 Tax=Candidatus Nitrosocosmicus franklandianus TaxID=1798806 RepID=A0A484IFK4_9ARCH|nr:HAMP domain-containing sensor histidine kinase [Candidatus Nitrosocosmicus franklandus]VFJ14939.1 Sensor protein SrrB [Candidatus Nitrosocosmicus franklandus]
MLNSDREIDGNNRKIDVENHSLTLDVNKNLYSSNQIQHSTEPKRLLQVDTRIIDNPVDVYSTILGIVSKSDNGISNCSTIGGLKMIYENKDLFNAYVDLLSKYKEGKAKGAVRWITHIDKNNEQIDLINKFLNIGIEIRHVNNLPPMSFAVSDKQFQGTIEKMDQGKMFDNILYSTEPLYIKHFQLFFEEMWRSGVDAKQRVDQIVMGVEDEYTKVFENQLQIKNIFLEVLENAQEEILIIFPSLNSVKRQAEIGLFNLFKLKNQPNFQIRILCPFVDVLKEILLLEYSKEKVNSIANIAIREIVRQQSISSIVLITDRKNLITIEVKDDTKEKFEGAIGFTTFSTSKPTVNSYLSIFETLWAQTEISDSLRIANEKLVESEEMEREFINTAAHELRTPTQAIMGYAELDAEVFGDLLENPKIKSDNQLNRTITHLQKHFEIISRNSARLDDLISKLLDVSRIESNLYNSLSLHKEGLDLVKEIKESINIELNQKIRDKNINIILISDGIDGQMIVNADKSRLHQIVINIVGNAIKFSNRNDKIDITIREKSLGQKNTCEENKNIFVKVSDSGKGISPHVLPKLFEKFVSDSDIGTGLGLYISKNLVEAHGGKIWAYNNLGRPGSTFVFSLPKLI